MVSSSLALLNYAQRLNFLSLLFLVYCEKFVNF